MAAFAPKAAPFWGLLPKLPETAKSATSAPENFGYPTALSIYRCLSFALQCPARLFLQAEENPVAHAAFQSGAGRVRSHRHRIRIDRRIDRRRGDCRVQSGRREPQQHVQQGGQLPVAKATA